MQSLAPWKPDKDAAREAQRGSGVAQGHTALQQHGRVTLSLGALPQLSPRVSDVSGSCWLVRWLQAAEGELFI